MLHDAGRVVTGQTVVITVTGHGLKDVDAALSAKGPLEAATIPADAAAAAAVIGLA